MKQVTSTEELHLTVEFNAPQVQVRLERSAWNKLCDFVEMAPFPIDEYKYAPDEEVGIFVLKKRATGRAEELAEFARREDNQCQALWYSPFPFDPTACKECGSKEARSYPEHLDSMFCEACANVVAMRKAALIEQFKWVRRWQDKGLGFDDLLALAKGGVSIIASSADQQGGVEA